ncbi:hypothetical protein [Niallia sp. BSM11]|uniref:hypothetical protein n=1 Tax=Niallia sp. BSM11 TaxID=3391576 RepID=UPI003984BF88
MEKSKEITLFDRKITLSNNKLLFEGDIVYDFEDRYQNISSLAVEKQIQIFYQLIELINGVNVSSIIKAETILILSQIFKNLSSTNKKSSLLTIGGSVFSKTYAEIITFFGSENKLYEVFQSKESVEHPLENIIPLFIGEDFNMDFLAENYFSFILINVDSVSKSVETVISECNRLISKHGNIICYGSNLYDLEKISSYLNNNAVVYQIDNERFLININMCGNKLFESNVKERIVKLIELRHSELFPKLEFVMSERPTSKNDEWYTIIDNAIYLIAEIETIISENHMLFDNNDLKFQTNEVKNALLDIKYEAFLNRRHYDFFQSNLFDCYNSWIENLKNM